MNCNDIRDLLDEYLEGSLDEQQHLLIKKHLQTCSGCSLKLADLQAYKVRLDSLIEVSPPADFLEQVHRRIESGSGLKRFFQSCFTQKLPLRLTATVAVVLIGFAIARFYQPMHEAEQAYLQKEKRAAEPAPAAIEKQVPVPTKEKIRQSPAGAARALPEAQNQGVFSAKRPENADLQTALKSSAVAPQMKAEQPKTTSKKKARVAKKAPPRAPLLGLAGQESLREEERAMHSEVTEADSLMESAAFAPQDVEQEPQLVTLTLKIPPIQPLAYGEEPAPVAQSKAGETSYRQQITRHLENLGARILPLPDEKDADEQEIVAELPVKSYTAFLRHLQNLGDVKESARTTQDTDTIRLHIKIKTR